MSCTPSPPTATDAFRDWMAADLQQRQAQAVRRELHAMEPLPHGRVRYDGREMINLCGNDYLGLMPELAASPEAPVGATASRLICGTHPQTAALERDLAEIGRAHV